MKYNEVLVDIQDQIKATCNLGADDTLLVASINLTGKTDRIQIAPHNRDALFTSFMLLQQRVVEVQCYKSTNAEKDMPNFSFAVIENGMVKYQLNSADIIWKGE